MPKRILIIVDMQNDFIDGVLGSENAKALIGSVCTKIECWSGDLAITKDTHGEDYLDTPEGKLLPVPHCVDGTTGHRLNDRVFQAFNRFRGARMIFHKKAFGCKVLGNFLSEEDYDEVFLCGLCTDFCVLSNAIIAQAALPNAQIVVDASCCAGSTPQMHEKTLEIMEHLGIEVINKE